MQLLPGGLETHFNARLIVEFTLQDELCVRYCTSLVDKAQLANCGLADYPGTLCSYIG